MKLLSTLGVPWAFGIAMAMGGGAALAACKDNWKECAGKPWVDGKDMQTPLGSKWWPNPLWGGSDQAGSTNWYTKPEVVMRALSMVKQGNVMKLESTSLDSKSANLSQDPLRLLPVALSLRCEVAGPKIIE